MALNKMINFWQLSFNSILALFILMLISGLSFAQNEIDGIWKSENDDYMIKITSLGKEYQARIVWLRDEIDANGMAKLDEKNPDEKYRKIPLKGLKILTGLINNSNNTWNNGKLYIPEKGEYYSCSALVNNNQLILTYSKNGGTPKRWDWTKQE